MRLTGGCIYCLIAERLPGSAAGVPPRARRPLRSRSRLSPSRRRWLRARNKSRGRARAHGPRARGGQEARHHSGTARPRESPHGSGLDAAPGWASAGAPAPLLGLCPRPVLEGPRGKATRRPSCRGKRGAQGDPGSPELDRCCVREIGVGRGGGDWHLWEWGPWVRRALLPTTAQAPEKVVRFPREDLAGCSATGTGGGALHVLGTQTLKLCRSVIT